MNAIQSVKRTKESSPAIHRWDHFRTSTLSPCSGRLNWLSHFIQTVLSARLRISAVRFTDSQFFSNSYPSTQVLGYCQSSASRTPIIVLRHLACAIIMSLACVAPTLSQTGPPQIFKVDPPSWWTRSSVNPVRLLIRGKNLAAALD